MKLRTLIRIVIVLPLLAVLAAFVLSNQSLVSLRLAPFGALPFEVPLSVVVLAGLGIGYFIGGLHGWIDSWGERRAARRTRIALSTLEAKHQEVWARLGQTTALPPPGQLPELPAPKPPPPA